MSTNAKRPLTRAALKGARLSNNENRLLRGFRRLPESQRAFMLRLQAYFVIANARAASDARAMKRDTRDNKKRQA